MRDVRDIPHLENVPVLLRTALNVPIEDGHVTNDYRLRRDIATIRHLTERHARVVVVSHIGEQGTETLAPIAEALRRLIPSVSFFPESIGPRVRDAVRRLSPGDILVLENLRRNKGEIKNDPIFARELASLADVFVQDSFDTCHRLHASIVGVPALLPSYAGLLLEEEFRELSAAREPKRPSLAVVSGAKFSTKEPVVTELLKRYDHVFVGGALGNDFLKASGREVGKSMVSHADEGAIKKLLKDPKLILPTDAIVVPADAIGTIDLINRARTTSVDDVHPDEVILDIGPGTSALLASLAAKSKTVLWNGPLGKFEDGFTRGTDDFARAVATSRAYSVIGGGDSIASIESLGLLGRFSFVSTGGGAMLDFLAAGHLPGIDALDTYPSV